MREQVSKDWLNKTHVGDCRDLMRQMIADGVTVQSIVTSPPYYGLRDYGVNGQIGLESSFYDWIDSMVEVFGLAYQVLADDGTLWLNLGDSYAQNGGPGWQGKNGQRADRRFTASRDTVGMREATRRPPTGLKAKDLMGQPWRVAFALQDAGWYLRSDIIWHKPNPMPESVYDRPTKGHEYIFLLTKSERYHYDAAAIAEPVSGTAHARGDGLNRKIKMPDGWDTGAGGHGTYHRAGREKGKSRPRQNASFSAAVKDLVETRNVRTVWTMPSEPFSAAHFATFPRELPKRCILAGTKAGDTVFDPFMGSGTVGQVATDLGRNFIGCELNPEYVALHYLRSTTIGMAV